MTIAILILASSILIQVTTAILALRLIKTTRYYWSWIFLAMAIGLMAARRMITFYDLLSGAGLESVNISAEITALIISVFMFIGILNIRPLLNSIYSAKNELEESNKRLQKEVELRKFAENLANANAVKFKKLTEATPVLIWMSDENGECTYFNQRWLDFRGRKLEDEKGSGWTEGIHPDDKQKTIDDYYEAFNNREQFELEYRLKNSNGEYRWIYDIGSPMYDGYQKFTGYIGSCIDITERIRYKEELKRAEREKSLILNAIQDKLVFLDPEQKVQWTNQAALDIIGKYCYNAWHEFDTPCDNCPAKAALDTGQTHKVELTFDEGVFSIRAFPVEENGSIKGVLAIARNITYRKEAEKQLKQSEKKFRKIVNILPQFVSYVECNLVYHFVNKAYLDKFNLREEDIIGKKLYEIIGTEAYEKAKPHLAKVLKGQLVRYNEFFRYSEDYHAYMQGTLIPEFDQKGNVEGYYAILSDITELMQNQKLIEESRNRLRILSEHQQIMLEKERSYIAREIHDELGQNLTVINMELSMMKKQIPRSERNLFAKIHELINLTQSTLSKTKKLSSELRPQLIDDMGLIAALDWYLKDFEKRSGIKCISELPDENVNFPQQTALNVFRIIQESLTNIYKHADAHSAKVKLEIENKYLFLNITDDGTGINEKDVNKDHSYGIMGIEERVRLLSGEFSIENTGNGTMINIKIPFEK